jgi:hypothetical protein
MHKDRPDPSAHKRRALQRAYSGPGPSFAAPSAAVAAELSAAHQRAQFNRFAASPSFAAALEAAMAKHRGAA